MSKQREDIEIEYLGGATYFDDFTGIDTHLFDFNVTINDETEKFGIFVTGSHQGIDRVAMREDFKTGTVVNDEATFKYVMDEMDKVIKLEFDKEYQELLQFEKDMANGVGIASKDFGDKEPEIESEKPKKKKNKGFGFSL